MATTAARNRLEPSPLQSFADAGDHARLTKTAIKAMVALVQHWKLTGGQAAALLAVSPSTWSRIQRSDRTVLRQDQLTRISALVGIFKGLHLLFADDLADRWVRLRNRGPLFANRTPVEAMIEGGIPVMLDVRRYIDALRGVS